MPPTDLRVSLPDGLANKVRELQQEWARVEAAEPGDADRTSGLARRFRALCGRVMAPTRPYFEQRQALRGQRREALDHVLILGRTHLVAVLREYVAHHNSHRPHRGLGLRRPHDVGRPIPSPGPARPGTTHRREILGGLIHEYRVWSSPGAYRLQGLPARCWRHRGWTIPARDAGGAAALLCAWGTGPEGRDRRWTG